MNFVFANLVFNNLTGEIPKNLTAKFLFVGKCIYTLVRVHARHFFAHQENGFLRFTTKPIASQREGQLVEASTACNKNTSLRALSDVYDELFDAF